MAEGDLHARLKEPIIESGLSVGPRQAAEISDTLLVGL